MSGSKSSEMRALPKIIVSIVVVYGVVNVNVVSVDSRFARRSSSSPHGLRTRLRPAPPHRRAPILGEAVPHGPIGT